MPVRPARVFFRLALFAAAALPLAPASALVGATSDGRFSDRVAMVLMRGAGEAGFCSALVLDSRTLLTAAHCLKPVRDMAVHYRDASGAPVVILVEAAVAHPLYRPDAIKNRVESIDAALIRTASPLDPRFVDAALAAGEAPAVGEPVILSGYGVTRDGDWKSGGELRSVSLRKC
jgi:trypsin